MPDQDHHLNATQVQATSASRAPLKQGYTQAFQRSIQEHERMWLRYQATLALSALGAETAVEEGKKYINQNISRYGWDGKSRIRKKLESIERNLKNYKKLAKRTDVFQKGSP